MNDGLKGVVNVGIVVDCVAIDGFSTGSDDSHWLGTQSSVSVPQRTAMEAHAFPTVTTLCGFCWGRLEGAL